MAPAPNQTGGTRAPKSQRKGRPKPKQQPKQKTKPQYQGPVAVGPGKPQPTSPPPGSPPTSPVPNPTGGTPAPSPAGRTPVRGRYAGELDALTRMEFGGYQAQLDQQSQRIPGFFDQYLKQLETSRVAQNAYYQGAMSANAQMAQQAAAPTQFQGVPGGQVQQDSANAGQIRKTLVDLMGEALRGQDASYNAAKEDQKVVGSAARLTAQTDNAAAQAKLARDKGAFRVSKRAELKDRDWTKRLERAAFNLKEYEAAADVKTERKKIRLDKRKENQDVNAWGYTAKEWRAKSQAERQQIIRKQKASGKAPNTKVYPGGRTWDEWKRLDPAERERLKNAGGGSDAKDTGLTPAQQRARRKERREAASKVQTALADMNSLTRVKVEEIDDAGEGTGKFRPPTRDEVLAQMRKQGYSQDQITVALALRHKEATWDAATRAAAKRLGMRVPAKYRPVKYKNSGFGA